MTSGTVVGKRLTDDISKGASPFGGAAAARAKHTKDLKQLQAAGKKPKRALTGAEQADLQATHTQRFPRRVEKGMLRQSVAPRLARKKPAAGTGGRRFVTGDQNSVKIIGKGAFSGAFRQVRGTASGFKAGVTGKPKTAGPLSNEFLTGQKAGAYTLTNKKPLAIGAGLGGTTVAGYSALNKRHGDPEDARQARLGAASAASAIGGAGLGAYALRDAQAMTRVARAGQVPINPKSKGSRRAGTTRQVVEFEGPKGQPLARGRIVDQRLVHAADRLPKSGYAISRRGGAAGVGGLALLGGAEALRRKATERRWN